METQNYAWRNWFGNLHHTVDLYEPRDLGELREAVRRAASKGHVRTVGGSYAWSPLVPVDRSIVSLKRLRGVHTIVREGARPSITVETGCTIRELVELTEKNGLTLITPTIFQELTLGGALAVGAHGTGLEWATMSDAVTAMTIVDARGEVVRLSAADGELFHAARVALGTFGAIVDVTLECEPAFNVHVEDRFKPREEVLDNVDDLLRTYEFVELYWFPFNEKMWIKVMRRTDEPVPPDGWREQLDGVLDYAQTMIGVKYVLPILSRYMPKLTPAFMKIAPEMAMTPGTDIEPASEEFHYQQAYPRCWNMSWAVPLADTVRAWRTTMTLIDEFARRGKYPVNMVVHSRFIGESPSLLAASHGWPACDIEIATAKGTPDVEPFFEAFADAMLAIPGARPHWGKYILRPREIRARYSKMDAFLAHRAAMDPSGVFLNDFLAREVFQL